MDNIASVIVWGVSLIIGVPMVLIGAFHLLFPRAAWSVYRGWGKLWGSDPAEIAPAYKSGAAMRVVGLTLVLGGATICYIPKLMGH